MVSCEHHNNACIVIRAHYPEPNIVVPERSRAWHMNVPHRRNTLLLMQLVVGITYGVGDGNYIVVYAL